MRMRMLLGDGGREWVECGDEVMLVRRARVQLCGVQFVVGELGAGCDGAADPICILKVRHGELRVFLGFLVDGFVRVEVNREALDGFLEFDPRSAPWVVRMNGVDTVEVGL